MLKRMVLILVCTFMAVLFSCMNISAEVQYTEVFVDDYKQGEKNAYYVDHKGYYYSTGTIYGDTYAMRFQSSDAVFKYDLQASGQTPVTGFNEGYISVHHAWNTGKLLIKGGPDMDNLTKLTTTVLEEASGEGAWNFTSYKITDIPDNCRYLTIQPDMQNYPGGSTDLKKLILYNVIDFDAVEGEFYEVTKNQEIEEALNLSYKLRLIDSGILTEERFDTPVTRGEFAYSLSKLIGIDSGEFSYDNYYDRYSDINSSTDYAYNIQLVSQLGYLPEMSDGSFRPNDFITEDDALYAILSLLGYQRIIDARNPSDMYKLASKASLNYTATGGNLTVRKASELIFAALNAKTATYSWNDEFVIGSETYMENALKLEKIEGQITFSKYGTVSGSDYDEDNVIEIDGNKFYTELDYFHKKLGENVWGYIKENNGKHEIVTLGTMHTNAEKFTVSIPNFDTERSSLSMVYYDDNGKDKKKSLKISKLVINGERTYDLTAEKLYACDIITFVDGNGDGVYDTALGEKYSDFYVKTKYVTEMGISDLYTEEAFYFDAQKYTHINYLKDGEKSDFESIGEGKLVSIAVSENGQFVKAIINTGFEEGMLSHYDMTDNVVTVNNKKCYIASSLLEKIDTGRAEKLQLADEGKFYFNAVDQIAAYSLTSTREAYGFMIKCGCTGVLSETLMMQLLDESGKVNEYECTDEVNIIMGDSTNRVDAEQAMDMISSVGALNKDGRTEGLIRYRINKDGKVNSISIPKTEADERVFSLDYEDSEAYTNAKDIINDRYGFDSNTSVFYIPYDRDEYDRYKNTVALTASSKDSTYKINIKLYDVNSLCFAGALVFYERENTALRSILTYTNLAYVAETMSSYNEFYDEARPQISVMRGGTQTDYYLADNLKIFLGRDTKDEAVASSLTAADIEKGDIVKFATNDKGEIGKIVLYYDRSESKYYKSDGSASTEFCIGSEAEYVNIFAGIDLKYGKYLKLDAGSDNFLCDASSANIALYETGGIQPSVKKGKLDDINKGDKAVVRINRGKITDLMIIR